MYAGFLNGKDLFSFNVANSFVDRNTGVGIQLFGTTQGGIPSSMLRGNLVTSNDYGIVLSNYENVTLSANNVFANGSGAIKADQSVDITTTKNNYFDNRTLAGAGGTVVQTLNPQ